jgi:hypothetical protein
MHIYIFLPVRIVSVIVTSPTEGQTAALLDRFYRCLHRLRAVFQGGGVMPGAGVPELLCCLQIDNEIDIRTAELLDLTSICNKDMIQLQRMELLQEILTLLRAAQKGFFSYIRTVSMNNVTPTP